MAVAYKVVQERNSPAAEKKLNELANQGWRVILCVGVGVYYCWTLERSSTDESYRESQKNDSR